MGTPKVDCKDLRDRLDSGARDDVAGRHEACGSFGRLISFGYTRPSPVTSR